MMEHAREPTSSVSSLYHNHPSIATTKMKDDDTQSIFSDSATLFEVPAVLYDHENRESIAANDRVVLLPSSQVFATIYVSYESCPPDPQRYVKAGIPAKYQRRKAGDGVVESGSKLSKLNFLKKAPSLTKRLEVQIPRAVLDLASQRCVLAPVKPGRMATIMQTLSGEIANIRHRRFLDQVVALAVKREDISNVSIEYPFESVIRAPGYLKGGSAASPARYATLQIITPRGGSISTSEAAPSSSDSCLVFEPTQEAEIMLTDILNGLERRGSLWTLAGHNCRGSQKNLNPRQRPEFFVLGFFPEPFLDRCKAHRDQEMGSDLSLPLNDKWAPFIISAKGKELEAQTQKLARDEHDALAGCTVSVVYEPYRGARASRFGAFVDPRVGALGMGMAGGAF